MAEYIKREDAKQLLLGTYDFTILPDEIKEETAEGVLQAVPSIDIDDDAMNEIDKLPAVEPKIYGDEHDCMMTMFGECSYSETGCGSCEVVAKVFEALKNECPPVELERPKGEWKHGKELSRVFIGDALREIKYVDWHCSNCHCVVEQSIKPEWRYCPNCGADMRGDTE